MIVGGVLSTTVTLNVQVALFGGVAESLASAVTLVVPTVKSAPVATCCCEGVLYFTKYLTVTLPQSSLAEAGLQVADAPQALRPAPV